MLYPLSYRGRDAAERSRDAPLSPTRRRLAVIEARAAIRAEAHAPSVTGYGGSTGCPRRIAVGASRAIQST